MNIFYNRHERRLRAGFRLPIHLALNYFGLGLINLLPALAIMLVLMLVGVQPFRLLSNGTALSQAMEAQFRASPPLLWALRMLSVLLLVGIYALLARWLDRRRLQDYGLRLSRAWWRDFAFGLALGGLLMGFVFVFEWALGWVKVTTFQENQFPKTAFWVLMLNAFFHYIFVGVSEEMFSRGYQLRNLAEGLNLPRLGPRWALLISYLVTSSIFGLLHFDNDNVTWLALVNIALIGLMFGLGLLLTGDLAIAIGLHITWNFFQGNVFGFPVSGYDNGISLIGSQQLGPEVWTGGAFGPEGGLVGVLALLLGLALIWAWVRWTHGETRLHTVLAEYNPPAPKAETPSLTAQPSHTLG